jgi:hypothetical protein
MNIIKVNITNLWKQGKIVCVTTNGFVKRDGSAVMGRGNALAMAQTIPDLPKLLGQFIKKYGNRVGFIYQKSIIAFPVKPITGTIHNALPHITQKMKFKETDTIPGFWCKADLTIIETSMTQLNELIKKFNLKEVYLPVPGVNNGQLKFTEVESILMKGVEEIKICSL